MVRQKRVTVAGDTPACSASSPMERVRGACGWLSRYSATRATAEGISANSDRIRSCTAGLCSHVWAARAGVKILRVRINISLTQSS